MLLELFLNGLIQGSLLALICIGYSLAYGTAKVLNFAHADAMVTGGGYWVLLLCGSVGLASGVPLGMGLLFGTATSAVVWFWLHQWNKSTWVKAGLTIGGGAIVGGLTLGFAGRLPFLLAALLAIPCTAFLATAIYQVVYLPLIRKGVPRTSILVASFGISIALQSLLLVMWGSQRRVFPAGALPPFLVLRAPPDGCGFWRGVLEFGACQFGESLRMPARDALIVLTFLCVAAALFLFFRFSRLADSIIASADDRLAATACGIPVDRVVGYAFCLGGAIASIGGTFYVLRSGSLDPMAGFTPGILAFVACVLGGIGSLRGSIAGAFLVGLIMSMAPGIPVDKWAAGCLPESWNIWLPSLKLSDWSYGVVYVLMILTILIKPRGLFAR